MTHYEIAHVLTSAVFVYAHYLLLESFLGNEVHDKNLKNIEYITFFITSTLIIFVTRVPIIMFLHNMFFLFIISLNYKASMQRKIVGTTFAYGIGVIVEIIISISFSYTNIQGLSDSEFNSVIGLIIIRVALLIIAYLLNRFASVLSKSLEIPKAYYFMFAFISLGTIYLFLNGLIKSDLNMYNVLCSSVILCGINILMIVMDEKIYKSIILSKDKEKLHQQNIAYENQNNLINQTNARIKMLEHDMKNHLEILSKMYEEDRKDKIEEYTKSIIGKLNSKSICNSNNFVIDSIVNFKLATLDDKVKLKVDICIPYTLNILAVDLTTILGNFLDNAITGVTNAKEKIIDLEISYKKENLIIILKNSFDGKLIEDNGKFKTTKVYKSKHGIGIGSVEETLETYGGSIDIEHTSNMFSVAIIIPLSKI